MSVTRWKNILVERVIDHVDCDVLVIKPAGFKTPVARKFPPFPTMLEDSGARRRASPHISQGGPACGGNLMIRRCFEVDALDTRAMHAEPIESHDQ